MSLAEQINELGDELIKPYIVASDLPLVLGRHYLELRHKDRPLRRFNGEWFAYDGKAYIPVADEQIRVWMYKTMERLRKPNKDNELRELRVNSRLVSNVLDALPACDTLLTGNCPQWVDGRPGAADYAVFDNGIMNLITREEIPHTPALFTQTQLPYAINKSAPPPKRMFEFLESIWGDDDAPKKLLQEWLGYILTGDNRYQKMLLIVGPTRCGKGSIAHIAKALIGAENCCSPKMGTLATPFGMASIIGKRLAIFGDARISGRMDTAAIVDGLLSLSGGDLQTIPRKFKDDWIGEPETKIFVLSNELPRLHDAAGAIGGRFTMLKMTESFLGREDHNLLPDLLLELPSIMNWALQGLDRLRAENEFTKPAASVEALQSLTDLASPIGVFVRERCELGKGIATPCSKVYEHWREWCDSRGEKPTSQPIFGRDLAAAFPQCTRRLFRSGGQKREYNYSNLRMLE
jgi:putative DNA primase/helicase